MTGFDPERLRKTRSLDDVIALLADELDWPVDNASLEDAAFFDYEPDDLGIPREQVPQLRSLRQLRPLTANQPWGIFFLELEGPRLPVTPLRRLLRGLVTRRRATRDGHRTWDRDDLLFFTSTSDVDGIELHLLAFFDRDDGVPEIRSLPWNPARSTPRQLERLAHELLPRLEWPDDPRQADAWRTAWRDAFRLRHGETLRSAADLADRMAGVAIDLRDAIARELRLEAGEGTFATLQEEVRRELDPDIDDAALADMCAQTLVSGALTARVIDPVGFGASPVLTAVPLANPFLNSFFQQVHDQVASIDLEAAGFDGLVADLRETNVEAVLDAFGSTAAGGDPVIHFYERFLAAYDPGIRADVGAYYTPQPVVDGIVRLVDDALRDRLGLADGAADMATWAEVTARLGFALPDGVTADAPFVSVLDPATGTGTFLVSWLRRAQASFTAGHSPARWDERLRRQVLPQLRAFELLLAPYAIAHLKLAMEVGAEAATEAASSILLTDTLEWPGTAPALEDFDPVAAEGQRAAEVKGPGRPSVIVGNPPYGRVRREDGGGWVANADGPRPALMQDWIDYASRTTNFAHVASLYDRYVYFWRWALWKAFEQPGEAPGIVAFITGATWLDGPGFVGVREAARALCSHVCIVDLGGDSRGTDPEENVFDIQTPVAIAVLTRAEPTDADTPARIWYRRLRGNRSDKLAAARTLRSPDRQPDEWSELLSAIGLPFKPAVGGAAWTAMPALRDLLPWQQPGCKLNRTWVVAPDTGTLEERWRAFLHAEDEGRRAELFPNRNTGRTITTQVGDLPTLASLATRSSHEPITRYQWRPFDREWTFRDPRLAKTESPALWQSASVRQLFLAAPMGELGPGPAVHPMIAPADLHVFCNRGGKDILPLYRDAEATQPNVSIGLLPAIGDFHRREEHGAADPSSEDLAAYIYALLSTPVYQQRFAAELADKVIRIPLTADPQVWTEAVQMGEELLWLHTFGERFAAGRADALPEGRILLTHAITRLPEDRSELLYDTESSVLSVADGRISGVAPEVYAFSVSGWPVVQRWLEHRTRKGRGKKSSELDDIRPHSWQEEWTAELLELLRALDGSLLLQPAQDDLLARIADGPLIDASDLPSPSPAERQVPITIRRTRGQERLH